MVAWAAEPKVDLVEATATLAPPLTRSRAANVAASLLSIGSNARHVVFGRTYGGDLVTSAGHSSEDGPVPCVQRRTPCRIGTKSHRGGRRRSLQGRHPEVPAAAGLRTTRDRMPVRDDPGNRVVDRRVQTGADPVSRGLSLTKDLTDHKAGLGGDQSAFDGGRRLARDVV